MPLMLPAPSERNLRPALKPELIWKTEPGTAVEGQIEIGGFAIVNGSELDATLPGFTIATCAVPAVVNRLAGTVACNCEVLMKLAGKLTVAFVGAVHRTVAPATKLPPFAVRESAPEFGAAAFGVSDVNTGVTPILVESLALPGHDPPPVKLTLFTSGELALAATFTVTVIGGYVSPGANASLRVQLPAPLGQVHPV